MLDHGRLMRIFRHARKCDAQEADDAATKWIAAIAAACVKYSINGAHQKAAFLAQCLHESAGLLRLAENLNYSAPRLRAVWPKRFPTDEAAQAVAHNPRGIANVVYNGRNGNVAGTDDGWTFRGRGPFMLTGRANYQAFSDASGINAVEAPDLLVSDTMAGMYSAGWYWYANKLGALDGIDAISKRINGGTLGLSERRELYEFCRSVLGD